MVHGIAMYSSNFSEPLGGFVEIALSKEGQNSPERGILGVGHLGNPFFGEFVFRRNIWHAISLWR
jgi:hypothetical protein